MFATDSYKRLHNATRALAIKDNFARPLVPLTLLQTPEAPSQAETSWLLGSEKAAPAAATSVTGQDAPRSTLSAMVLDSAAAGGHVRPAS